MYDFFLGKWGLDWAAAIFMFISIYRLGEHKRDGFIHAAIASVFWILFNLKVESAAGMVANAIILAMSVRSFRKAGKKAEQAAVIEETEKADQKPGQAEETSPS